MSKAECIGLDILVLRIGENGRVVMQVLVGLDCASRWLMQSFGTDGSDGGELLWSKLRLLSDFTHLLGLVESAQVGIGLSLHLLQGSFVD